MASASDLLKQVQKYTIDNSPLILTVAATVGVVSTAVLSAKGAVKADRIVSEAVGHPDSPWHERDLTRKELFQLTWQCYVPTCGVGFVTIASIVGANRISTTRAAALATAFGLSEKAFGDYKEAVVKKLTVAKEKAIVDDVAQTRVERDYGNGEVLVLGSGEQLCHDSLSGRFFRSDMESLKAAMNQVNFKINNDMYASLSDFYDALGLEHTAISEELGWNSDKLLDIHFTTCLTPDGKPAISMEYRTVPIRGFDRLH